MTIYSMLTNGKSGVAARAICFCVARGNPTDAEIKAIRELINADISSEKIAARPLSAYARAALHVFGVNVYEGTNPDIIDAITLLSSEENIKDMRSCAEYRKCIDH